MTGVEKQINRADLKAWKAYDTKQYSLIPGLNHGQNGLMKSIDMGSSGQVDLEADLPKSPQLDYRKQKVNLNQSVDYSAIQKSLQQTPINEFATLRNDQTRNRSFNSSTHQLNQAMVSQQVQETQPLQQPTNFNMASFDRQFNKQRSNALRFAATNIFY